MTTTEIAPQTRLLELSTGYIVTKALAVAAALGVADQLAAGPRTAPELAAETGAHPRALYRILRCLAGAGVLTETDPETFALTAVGDCLRSDAPGSMRAWTLMNSEGMFPAFTDILHSVRTEEPAFERVLGAPLFQYLGEHPDQGAIFARAMGDFSRAATITAALAYDFGDPGLVIDVGGGSGALLASLLARYERARGVLFELPPVAAGAPDLGPRGEVVTGDFFRAVPAGGDVYLLSWILHDWDDERALAIVRNCRAQMAPGSRLVVIETLLPEGDEPHFGKVLDVAMLVLTGGRERSEVEYADLFAEAGLRLRRVVRSESPMSVLVGTPA